ncbi:oxidoreductase [Actinophytocola gossypii]|uniref:Oxidoreductase n=1 Tax=Actinophytocola gossypii TaxID=2812003 RepID=A0ABT2JCG4_9PSEU|nr:oxidoreductase [Actinophytocola gossypii]MCT2585545.1 oxidoreductase [Actinophytocola gossypii]
MPHTLVVGLGRSGGDLHVPVLGRLRHAHPELFPAHPIVGFDPRPGLTLGDGITVDSLDHAAVLLPPADTVAHVCTPPDVRVHVLDRLARLGFRRVVVEKPLVEDLASLAEVEHLRAWHGLDIVVVTHWLAATLTRRLDALVRSGDAGPLELITVHQEKPRFTRSAHSRSHTDAFVVEIPHALAVALTLAGPAELTAAGWTDAATGPLAGAWLTMRHAGGVRTTIRSDLTSPVRRRKITLRLRDAVAVGHYPVSADDHHAQLRVGATRREVFEDEALGAFLLAAYRYFAGVEPAPPGSFAVHADVVRLLAEARRVADHHEDACAG